VRERPPAPPETGEKASGKLWGGRYSSGTAPAAERFTASLPYDRRLWPQDIRGSRAHARMLAGQGIISAPELELILKGLDEISAEIEDGRFPWRLEHEDVHMNVEARLREKIGAAGGKLHTARSRNDQVALDMHLFVRDAVDGIQQDLHALQTALLEQARSNQGTVLPGYTHLQRAQPVALSQHLLAYFFMLQRDRERLADCRRRVDTSPLGAGALAGTTFPIDPDSVARELGFNRRYANSMDAVSDRDFILETLACCSIVAIHLSRLGEELVLWSSSEFGFLEMPDSLTTGSSIMPQKRNPVIGELLRGKAGRVAGAFVGLLMVLKGLPLSYNTDMQEDKEGTFDALDTVSACLRIAAEVIAASTFRADRMLAAAAAGYTDATDLADYLAAKGVPFREAHAIAGRAVARAAAEGVPLGELPLEVLQGFHPALDGSVYAVLTPRSGVGRRTSPMGTGPGPVDEQLSLAADLLAAPPGTVSWVSTG